MDDNHSNTINMEEFKKGNNDYRLGLSADDIKLVFSYFDKTGDGCIDYDEFLREVRV